MPTYTSFKSVFKKIENAHKLSAKQALNRAVNSTRVKYVREMSKELGVTSEKVKRRAQIVKAGRDSLMAGLNIGVRQMFAAHDFKVGEKVIPKSKVLNKRGKRWAATYKVKGQEKVLLKGAFVAPVHSRSGSKNLILQRVGSGRLPTKTVYVNVFRPAVEAKKPELQRHMKDTFEKNFYANVKFNNSKLGTS